VAAKLYPAGATTHSDRGVTDISRISRVLDEMEACACPCSSTAEVTDPSVDIFDRERVFIDRVLAPLVGTLGRVEGRARAREHPGGSGVRRRILAAGGGDG